MQEILALTGSHATGVSFKSGSFFPSLDEHHFMKIGDAHQIEIEGLGTILIGASSDIPNLYDKVVVRLNADRTLFELHEILSFVDLEQAVALSTKEDIERLKMGHLFRTFFPKEATPFERTEEFFKIPLEELKQKMIEKSPDMKEIFETYFHRMKAEPLFDGRIRYRIEGLAEAAYEKGARGLMSAVMGAYEDDELYSRVASMIRMGMLATEVRHTYQMDQHGLGGGGVDYPSGGADSIYTQLITERDCKEKVSFNRSNYHSKIRFIISLDALETGTYQYYDDNVGNRVYTDYDDDWRWFNGTYAERDGILEFIEKEQQGPFRGGHEVMFKERIAPSFFNRLVVSNQQTKLGLIQYLEKCGLIQNNLILNRPVDQFIRVSNKMNADLF
jgi:hypothetical protein